MGNYISLFKSEQSRIKVGKEEEFRQRIEKLFQVGGMMEYEIVSLQGFRVTLIKKAVRREKVIDVTYNYFEDDSWENAGFNKAEYKVYSEKAGWREFDLTILSAYALEEQYTDGVTATIQDGNIVTGSSIIGWLNYLFKEEYTVKNENLWNLYEAIHDAKPEYGWEEYINKWETGIMRSRMSTFGYLSIVAVEDGMNGLFEVLEAVKDTDTVLHGVKNGVVYETIRGIQNEVREFKEADTRSESQQIETLLSCMQLCYQYKGIMVDVLDACEKEGLKVFAGKLMIYEIPVIVAQIIAEEYSKDFWTLWDQIRDAASGSGTCHVYPLEPAWISPIRTSDFYRIEEDDLLLFWEGDGDVHLSEEIERWFQNLRERFDTLMNDWESVKGSLRWVLSLMDYADVEYYKVYTIADFFEETIDHLSDQKYLILWKIYEEMLHDPKMQESAQVIFTDDGERENKNSFLYPGKPYRKLITGWCLMPNYKKFNYARKTLRRYMALVANRKLREWVFGF